MGVFKLHFNYGLYKLNLSKRYKLQLFQHANN